MKIKQLTNKILVKLFLSLALSFGLLLSPVSASALSFSQASYFSSASGSAACDALNTLDSSQGCGSNSSGTVTNLIRTIVNIMSLIVGIAAVIMIIISGMRFITSGGDSQKVSSAKTALIYALIGLVVVALAQAIVHFTINTTSSSVSFIRLI